MNEERLMTVLEMQHDQISQLTGLIDHIWESLANMIPAMLEMIAVTAHHIDDEELINTISAKMGATEVIQRLLNGEDLTKKEEE